MRYVVDTNIWIYAVAGITPVKTFLQRTVEKAWIGYSAISRLEAFGYPGICEDEEKALGAILSTFHEVAVSSPVIDAAIGVRRRYKLKAPDAIIAATALVLESALVTRDVEHFSRVDGLGIVNPFDEPADGSG